MLVMVPVVDMLVHILDPVILSAFEKFGTFRSYWLDLSTFWKVSIKVVIEGTSLGGGGGWKAVLAKCVTQTILFERFLRGVELRVGSKSRTNRSIIVEVMKFLMLKMEAAVKREGSVLERRYLIKEEVYFMICFVDSLRWGKGFMMDSAGLRYHVGK